MATDYDLDAEREALKDLIERYENDDDSISEDPRYARLLRFWDAEESARDRAVINKDLRQNANPEVPGSAASQKPGRLRKNVRIVVHTRAAQRLFLGRMKTESAPAITGVFRFANACYWLWVWSNKGNPYADLMLIDLERRMRQLSADLRQHSERFRGVLDQQREQGFMVDVVESEQPVQTDQLNFGSAYGYTAASLIVAFDWYARMALTLETVDMIDSRRRHALVYEMEHKMRSILEAGATAHAILNRELLQPLTRADFGNDADDAAKARVEMAGELLGPMPADILGGSLLPSHHRDTRGTGAVAGTGGVL